MMSHPAMAPAIVHLSVTVYGGWCICEAEYATNPGGWPLSVTGLLATKPYRITPPRRAFRQ
jgi:hypothetical protein